MESIQQAVVTEIVRSANRNKKNKKKKDKKRKSKSRKLRRRRSKSKRHDSSDEESEDSFDDDFNEAVIYTNLDTTADRQLSELAKMQKELLDLQKPSDDEEQSDQDFLPASNQEAQFHKLEVYI